MFCREDLEEIRSIIFCSRFGAITWTVLEVIEGFCAEFVDYIIMDQLVLFLLATTIPLKLSFISSSLSKVCQVSRLFSLNLFFLS